MHCIEWRHCQWPCLTTSPLNHPNFCILHCLSYLHSGWKYTHTHTHTQPFYSSLGFVRDNPCELVPEGIFRHLLDFWCKMKITQADTPTIRMDCHPIQTNWCPHLCHPHHFLRRMPSLTQPSRFILAWDRHQICWLAYPVAWVNIETSNFVWRLITASPNLRMTNWYWKRRGHIMWPILNF